jgi:hypothetical protein
MFHEITAVGTSNLIKGNNRLKEAGYRSISVFLNPLDAGKPMKRRRLYSFVWLEEFGVVFHGNEAECAELFKRSIRISGDAFFFLDDDRAADNQERAADKGNHFEDLEACKTLPVHKMYPAKTVSIFDAHAKLRESHKGLCGNFICDGEQWPSRSTPGYYLYTYIYIYTLIACELRGA